jgi:hypothetical protein
MLTVGTAIASILALTVPFGAAGVHSVPNSVTKYVTAADPEGPREEILPQLFAAADPEGPREEILPQLFAAADPEGPREEVLPWLTADAEGPREEMVPPLFA